jgi:drug/metabolite transporter (DMT)-like permease
MAPVDWVSLTLLCALSLASADALTKRHLADYSGREILMVRFGLTGVLLTPGLWLMPLPPVPAAFWGWLVLLVPLEIVAMLLYVIAIRDGPLSHTLPYLAFTPVFAALTGWLVLGERVSPRGLAGVLLVVAGAWALNLQGVDARRPANWLEPFRALLRERGARLMLATAAIYSLTSVMGKAALQHATPLSFGPFYFVLIGAVTLVVLRPLEPRGWSALTRRPLANLAIAGLFALMVVTHFLALARVEVAYMIAVKRTSLVFGVLYGALLLGERDLARSLSASAIMVAGVALIVL